jgi:hypothetical protein
MRAHDRIRRLGRFLTIGVLVLGCATLRTPLPHRYRASGVAGTSTAVRHENGSTEYAVVLSGTVEYTLYADETAGVVRLRTKIRNDGRAPVRYDLERAVIAAADGSVLRRVASEEQPGLVPTDVERVSEEYRDGVRIVAPGQQTVVTRRYVQAEGPRRSRDLLLLARLSLGDVVRIGDSDFAVAFRLEEERS